MALKYPTVTIYKSENNGRWYWRLQARNGAIVATTSEPDGFPSRSKARASFIRLNNTLDNAVYADAKDLVNPELNFPSIYKTMNKNLVKEKENKTKNKK